MASTVEEQPGSKQLTRFLAVLDVLQKAPCGVYFSTDENTAVNMVLRFCLPLIVSKEYYDAERIQLEARLCGQDINSQKQNLCWIKKKARRGTTPIMGMIIAALSLLSQKPGEVIHVYGPRIGDASELTKIAVALLLWIKKDTDSQRALQEMGIEIGMLTEGRYEDYCTEGAYTEKMHTVTAIDIVYINLRATTVVPHICIVNGASDCSYDMWDTKILPLLENEQCRVICIMRDTPHFFPDALKNDMIMC